MYLYVHVHRYSFNGLWVINYMQLKYGVNRQLSTMISSSFWIAYAVGNIVIGQIASKYKKRKMAYLLTMLFVFVSPSIIVYGDASIPLAIIVLCNLLSGLGMGIVAVSFVVLREYNEEAESSDIATGFLNSVSISAGFITQPLMGWLIDYHWNQRGGDIADAGDGRLYEVSDYNFGFMVIPIVGALGIICSILVKETNGKSVHWGK